MLREPASSSDNGSSGPLLSLDTVLDQAPLTSAAALAAADEDLTALHTLLTPYFDIVTTRMPDDYATSDLRSEDEVIIIREDGDLAYTFTGHLKQPAHRVHKVLDNALAEQHRFALLRTNPDATDADPHMILIVDGECTPPPATRPYINILLFLLTVFSVFYAGAQIAISELAFMDPEMTADAGFSIPAVLSQIWRGYPYALSLLAILIPHEMGHYLMMRRHGVAASLPYFIPAWLISPFGTLGAAISLREPLRDRRVLLDVGVAGPIAGFVVAFPLVIYGLYTSTVVPIDTTVDVLVEGNSLIYAFAKIVALGQFYPTAEADVMLNQIAFAGWTGLLITALNLIPVGQLDGGHITYALFGDKARQFFYPVVFALIGISIVMQQITWGVFLVLIFFVGRFYAVPLDNITPLNTVRKYIGAFTLIIFILTFTPVPVYQRAATDAASGDNMLLPLTMGIALACVLLSRRHRSPFIPRKDNRA